MSSSRDLSEFIERVLTESRLPPATRDEVRKELESHMWEATEELRGQAEEGVVASAKARFGAPQEVGRALSLIHGNVLMRFITFCSFAIVMLPLPFAVLLGPMLLFTVFGGVFALPALVLGGSAMFARHLGRIRGASMLMLTAALGQGTAFLSWVISRRSIPAGEAVYRWGFDLPSAAKAGFPLSALELPPPPMGNDVPPMEMWVGVWVNQLVWFVVAAGVVLLLPKGKLSGRGTIILCGFIAGLSLIYNLALFTLWYD